MKSVSLVTLIFMLLLISACGKSHSGAGKVGAQLTVEPEGIYSAIILPINSSLSLNVEGAVTVIKYGDDINVRVKLKNAPDGIHMQGLYTGDSCPIEDLNGDALIDIKEAQKEIGRMLIPLDGDLGGRDIGSDYYPSSDYSYERSTSYSLLISDLKLKEGNLELEGKVVVIHGVPETYSLPASVSTDGQDSPQKTIPIACGILSYVLNEPTYEEPLPEPTVVITPSRPNVPDVTSEPYHEEKPPTLWRRLRDRLESWWRRIGGWRGGNGRGDDENSL